MKIAVTYDNGQIYQHFGHTEKFKIYEVENGAVISAAVADTEGQGHGALASFLGEFIKRYGQSNPPQLKPRGVYALKQCFDTDIIS